MGEWVRGCVGAWERDHCDFGARMYQKVGGGGRPSVRAVDCHWSCCPPPSSSSVPALQVCTAEGDVREGNTLYADATPVLRTLSGDVPATAGSVQYVACLQVLSCSVCP